MLTSPCYITLSDEVVSFNNNGRDFDIIKKIKFEARFKNNSAAMLGQTEKLSHSLQ